MSTSGTLNGNNVDGSEGSYFTWQLASQNVVGNYSTINWQVGWRFSTTSCRGLRKGSSVVNGTTVYSDQSSGDGVHSYVSSHDHQPKLQTASGSINIAHGTNGSKTFTASVSMTGWDGGPTLLSDGSDSWALPTIPRFSSAPSKPVISLVTSTSMFATFTDGTGGATIDSRQIGYGTNIATPTTIISSDKSTSITGLTPGTTYYIWARTHNIAGYSAWSAKATAVTLRVPDAPSTPGISGITQSSVIIFFGPNGTGGTPITAYEVGYGTSSVAPTTTELVLSPTIGLVPGYFYQTISGLDSGTKYYFWVRAQNSVGWGPWSGSSSATTISGARVKVGLVHKQAIPFVKDGGVWKPAAPWVKKVGVWKETL